MCGEAFCQGVRVFLEDRGDLPAVNFFESFVISGLDAGVIVGGVHDVGLHEDDGAIVEAVC